MFGQDGARKLTATINWCEVACGDEALYVRRLGIGRHQERAKCYATLRQVIGTGQDKDAPIQNVPMRPKQPSSIRVDTGFMLRLKLKAELHKRV
jgi:hypothetical protein